MEGFFKIGKLTPEQIKEMISTTKMGLVMMAIGLPIVLFVFSVGGRKHIHPGIMADNPAQISSVVVDGKYGGNNSGELYYTRDSLVASSSLLIGEILCDSLWETGLIDKSGEPYKYRLGDLVLPYVLSKESDSDTLVVYKDGHEFKFLLPKTKKKEPCY